MRKLHASFFIRCKDLSANKPQQQLFFRLAQSSSHIALSVSAQTGREFCILVSHELGQLRPFVFRNRSGKKTHSFTILHFLEPIAKQANLSCKLTRSIKVRRQSISTVCPHSSTPFCVRQGGRSIFICDRFDTVLMQRAQPAAAST